MTRLLRAVLGLGIVALLMLTLIASAGQASPGTSTVVGAGKLGIDYTFGSFVVSARSGPQGDSGFVHLEYFGEGYRDFTDLSVQCVNVVGSKAFLTGTIVNSNYEWQIGLPMGVIVKDEGAPSSAPVDGVTGTLIAPENPSTYCRTIEGGFNSFTNVGAGNVVVNGG